MIPRLYEVSDGSIFIQNQNIKSYDLKTLRQSIGFVLQNTILFSGTILENLKWGNQEATSQEVEEVCKIAQAHDFIEQFPEGYNTVLGQKGVNLSGGQKQRIAIARALLKKPVILLLDDSTSAVDTATEAKIQKNLKSYLRITTTFIVAQRVNSIMNADKIPCVRGRSHRLHRKSPDAHERKSVVPKRFIDLKFRKEPLMKNKKVSQEATFQPGFGKGHGMMSVGDKPKNIGVTLRRLWKYMAVFRVQFYWLVLLVVLASGAVIAGPFFHRIRYRSLHHSC